VAISRGIKPGPRVENTSRLKLKDRIKITMEKKIIKNDIIISSYFFTDKPPHGNGENAVAK
jgi:hypothetical protein